MNIPPIVKNLLLINIVAYIADIAFENFMGIPLSRICGLYYFWTSAFSPYQIFTYMFMHGSFTHLFFNMFALWMFGRIMEQVWGGKRFLMYYIFCGIGAAITQELFQLLGFISPYAMTIGASGAVYGILLAFGMTFPNERLFIIPIPFPIKAKYFVMIYTIIELYEGMTSMDGVAHFAHLGGMLFGFILIMIWRNKKRRGYFREGESFWTSSTYDNYESDSSMFDKLKGAFKGKKSNEPKMTITYGEKQKDYEYNARKKAENEEIDRILDKVRKSGYTSLTNEEKEKLFDASKK